MMHLDLIDLRLFLHVVEAGSITGGAARSHLALPSASVRIRGMEQRLGLPLLERGRRGVRQTPAGRALAHHAALVLQQVQQLEGELAGYTQGLKGHVRLLANTAALSEFLPESLAGFLSENPAIDVDLEERASFEIVESVAAGSADAGILADTTDLGNLETLPYRRDRLVAVLPASEPPPPGRLAFSDLLRRPWVGLTADAALQRHLAGHAARCGVALAPRMRVRSFEAVCRLVAAGVGVAVLPEAAARRCGETFPIRTAELGDAWADRHLVICCRKLADLPPQARRLIEHLRHSADAGAVARRSDGAVSGKAT